MEIQSLSVGSMDNNAYLLTDAGEGLLVDAAADILALLAFIGALVVFKAAVIQTEGGNKVGPWAWRPLLCILGANFTFGILLAGLPSLGIPSLGLVAAIYALTFIASLASGPLRLLEVFVLASVLAVGSSLAFVELLQLQLPLWPAFVAG